MDTQAIDEFIEILMEKSRKLDKKNLAEVLDFVDFLAAKNEEKAIKDWIAALAEKSKAFEFLIREPDIYSPKDVK